MGGSGLIVVVIVAAWALFLVPQWMHRRASAAAHLADRVPDPVHHEEDAERDVPDDRTAPSRRFGHRLLTRRTDARAGRAPRWWLPSWAAKRRPTSSVPDAGHSSRRRHVPSVAHAAKEDVMTSPDDRTSAQPGHHPSRRTAASRRRRLLGALAALTLVAALLVGVGAVAGLSVPAWLVAVPGGLMVAYLVLLAIVRPGAQHPVGGVRRDAVDEVDDAALPLDAEGDAGRAEAVKAVGRSGDVPVDAAAVVAGPSAHGAAHLPAAGTGAAQTSSVDRAGSVDAVPSHEKSTWTPVPVPTPTYVTAPRARRSVRTIDLSNPGSWTTAPAASVAATFTPATTGVEAGGSASEDEYVVEHRRAVGD